MRELDYHLGKLRLWPGEIVAGTLETTADGHRESWSVSSPLACVPPPTYQTQSNF